MGFELYFFLTLGVIQLLTAFFSNYKYIMNIQDQLRHLQRLTDIYDIMNDVVHSTSATRFLILKTHNGHGMPSLEKEFHISCIHSVNLGLNTKPLYQNMTVDKSVTQMLLGLDQQNILPYVVDLEEKDFKDQHLKEVYTEEGIKYSNLYFVDNTPTGMVYASISKTEPGEFSQEESVYHRLAIGKIKNLYRLTRIEKTTGNRLRRYVSQKLGL